MKSMSYICPYCKRNVFMNIGIHLIEHPCKQYLQHLENKSSNSKYIDIKTSYIRRTLGEILLNIK